MSILWLILLAVIAVIAFLSNISTKWNYNIKMCFYYMTILLHGAECCITAFPSFLQGKGADYIFNSFYYWCYWTGVRTHVRGLEHTQIDGPAVVICNHQSSIDIIGMTSCWPNKCAVMMKRILAFVPFFNLASYFANSIFIDRSNRERAKNSVDHCVSELKRRGLKIWMFPEGTRNREGGLMPFKKGAFNIAVRAQVPIIPVVFSDYSPFYSKNEKYFMNDGEVIIEVLPPISTDGLNIEDVPEFSEKVRQQMLNVYERISVEAKEMMEKKRNMLKKQL
ncbi:unnamed protein product [Caenorhabditis bovis]|uniref:1-acyl-sn-glycerol-3-phosphate acyltransferase n=1 Tax=Caenorhabditis bovis TaxID=2654633 RepID=A0A8S1EDU7_9PELO|nr:unnamed protein product [Caenorhabditis bovis]